MLKVSLKYGGILLVTSLICGLLVSSLYVIVDPIILERTTQKVKDNLKSIFSDSSFDYEEISKNYKLKSVDNADSLYEVKLADGSLNYVYEMSPEGRNDEILFLIAYDTKGNVVKIQYVQMRETKGRGDKITKDDYLNKIYSQTASEMDVDMIAGATYSSRAMKSSIESSSRHLITEVLK